MKFHGSWCHRKIRPQYMKHHILIFNKIGFVKLEGKGGNCYHLGFLEELKEWVNCGSEKP